MDMFVPIAILAAFVGGILTHKYVMSEAVALKTHISQELTAAKTATATEFASLREQIKAAVEFARKA